MRRASMWPSRSGRTALLAVCLAAVGPLIGPAAAAQRLEYGGGLSVATGKFIFSEPTTSWTLTNVLQLAAPRWRLGVSLPLVMQNSTAVTYIGGIPLPTGGPNSGAVRDRVDGEEVPMQKRRPGGGMPALVDGDLGALAMAVVDSGAVEGLGAYEVRMADPVFDFGSDLFVSADGARRLSAQLYAKPPVADPASGVGTGAFDWGAGLGFSTVRDRTLFFVTASHWVLGDLEQLPLSDLTSGSLGVGRIFGAMSRWSLLGSVSGSTALVETIDPPISAGVGLGYAPRPGRFLNLGLLVGLSESTADWTLSLGWQVGLTNNGWER